MGCWGGQWLVDGREDGRGMTGEGQLLEAFLWALVCLSIDVTNLTLRYDGWKQLRINLVDSQSS